MKKLLFIVGFILIFMMLFISCKKSKDMVSITTDIKKYTPMMSSKQGIKMTPDFKSNQKHTKLEYHWVAEKGSFINQPNPFETEVRNQGQPVLWSAIEKDKVADIKASFNIQLEVIDSENQAIIARTTLTITANNGFYEVKNQN